MPTELITSLQNPRVKQLVKLRDRRDRDESGEYLIEGYRPLLRALDNGFVISALYICPACFLGENEPALIARAAAAGAQVVEVTAPVLQKMTYRDRPEGLLAVAPQFHHPLADQVPGTRDFFVVAEAIEKPGNLGTMLRSCDAAAVDAFILCDPRTDIFNPNVVCASIGTLFTVPIWEGDTPTAVAWCRQHGVQILAATPHAERLHTQVDLRRPTAIVMGTEQVGLTQAWLDAADVRVKLPMYGQADSLNVATATTLLLYEVVRQRRLM